ncbi:MAG: recombinase RecT [Prevotella sp.]|nr:recombinase RecT [Prevotella sp.]
MSPIQSTVEELNKLAPLDIILSEAVRNRFIQVHDTLWGAGTGEPAYEREAIHFNAILRDNDKLQKATKFSIFNAFIDLAVCGLSLEPGTRALCYLMGRNYCIGTDPHTNKKVYEGRLVLTVSGYGELVLRARTGQIRHADNPVLVYEEDGFSFSDTDGRKQVSYTCNLPHKSNHVVAAYLRITRTDGSIDYAVMLEEDWLRLQGYSGKANKRWDDARRTYVEVPNELYTANGGNIDTGFLCAKCIKHAFKTYPKVRIGKAELETQQPDEVQQDIEAFYNMDAQPQPEQPAMPQDPNPPFGNQPDTSAGVTVDPAGAADADDGTF